MLGISGVGFALDLWSKSWAEKALGDPNGKSQIVVIDNVLGFILAYNKGGAFSMGASVSDSLRAPFFLVVGLVAIGFIVSLYRKVTPEQWTLRFGLPLVLAGALGNLYDRITKGKVVDFIDYRASWVELMNSLIAKVQSSWHVTDHWPTFNVADICITVGVGLMALDMFLSSRAQPQPPSSSVAPTARA
jgi:signal peptidase II